MLKRNVRSEFAGGVYVFPGGSVDPDDGDERAAAMSEDGPTSRPAPCSACRRGASPTGWPPCVSASRKPACSWPTGPRRGHRPTGRPPGRAAQLCRARGRGALRRPPIGAQRRPEPLPGRLHRGGARAGRRCRPVLRPLDHPRGAPRRYDTRFFVAAAPPQQTALHDASETVEHLWTSPAEALALASRREDRARPAHHQESAGHRALLVDRRAARRRGRLGRAGPHGGAPRGGRGQRGPHPPARRPRLRRLGSPRAGPHTRRSGRRQRGHAGDRAVRPIPGPADGPDDPPSPETLRIRS